MKKRILSAALALCMMFGSAAALPQGIFSSETSITASAITSGDYTYTELSDGTAQITRYIGSSTSITIPSTIDGKTVTSIKRVASTLKANTTLASITIPSSVKTVEEGAFRYCQALTSVTFKGDIESIGSAAFDGCIKLTTMKLPNGIKTLPANLFCGCTSLTSVNIPASVTSVSSKVFGSPDNESLGDLCTKLQTITVDSGNSSFSSVDGVLYNKAKTAIIWCPYDKTSLNIPGTVKSIPADTIYCKATSITLNSGTQSIAAQALVFCPQLKTITIPASVTNLGSQSVGYTKASMFDEATKIQSFTIRGYTGSAAETYAKENNFTFVSIGTSCTHSYTASSWAWTGYTAAKVTLKCSKCGDTRTVDATVTPTTKDATCTATGTKTYTATATVGSQNFKDQKTETIAAKGHSYSTTPTWSWNGTASATASFKCIRCTDAKTVNATITSKTTPATTTADGKTVYTATATYNGKNYTDTKTVTIPKLNCTHSYAVSSWTWSGYTSAKANLKCSKCGDTRTVDATTITPSITKAATCTTAGVRTYAATVTFNSKNYYDTKTETIAATGHSWGTPTWSWSGTTSATATFKCSKCGATQTAKATIASSVTKAATCTTAGVKTYTATAVFNSKNYYATKTEAIAATGHSWGTPTWSWNGTTSATATFKCSKCGATQSVSAKITSAETTPATCTTAGVKTYTATATFNSKNYTAAKTGTIAATGHNYVAKTIAPTCTAQGYTEHTCSKCHSSYNDNYKNATGHTFGEDPEWKWAADYSSATATFKCTKGDHVETISASISKTVKAATCAAEGSTTYNASVSFGGKTYTNAKAVPIPATGKHNYVTKTYAPTCKAEGYTEHKCSVCGHTYKTDVKSKVDHKWGSWKVIKAATETSTGTQEHTCTVCGAKETATIPKTTHKHSYTTKVVAPTCTDQGYTLHTCSCGYSYKDTYKNATGHSYTTKVTAPTCTAKGYTTHTCTKCKTSYKDTYTNPTGHKWNSGTITTQPTVIKTGVKTYTCTACKKTKTEAVNKLSLRLFGKSRYETSMAIATQLKKENGNKAFTSVIIASGTSNADALSAAYLAKVKNAPILITAPSETTTIVNYIKANAASTAKIYIVGGTGAVNADTEKKLKAIYKTTNQVVRLGGKTRFETNLLVLKEAKVSNQEILVASGMDYPDALSASAVGLPILLVSGNSLTAEQQTYLKSLKSTKITIVGGNGAVSAGVESSIKALKKFAAPTRLGGSNRYETSLMVANKYFASAPTMAVAYGLNFPDGLCGGPLAMKYKCPLLLATSKDTTSAHTYAYTHKETNTVTFGGTALVSDSAVKAIVG
ncbi:MAG: cell wall-binding repeat-containing protein [Ruminococcus sp.]|nr:cell wall-binding repeat-containing protein [Ruminococcus sp.]